MRLFDDPGLLDDERGQSIQVGAAILLGFVVIAITVYQVEVVAEQNADVEFEHSQAVQDQLVELRNDVVDIAGGGSSSSQTVTLGTSYPPRTIFINPTQPSGRLQTTQSGQLRVVNATATGEPDEVDAFWDGSAWARSTRAITYSPDYHEYDGAPLSIFEHGMLYNRHPNGVNRTVADQVLIDGSSITVLTVTGTLSESTTGAVSVETRAFSTSQNTVSVQSTTSQPITITLPTASPDHWAAELGSRPAVDQSSISIDRTTTPSTVTFELTPGTYSLSMAEVGVGNATQAPPASRSAYVVPVDRTAPTAVVEVRDAFNNPVRNVQVDVVVDGGPTTTRSTGSDGRVEIGTLGGGETVDVTVAGAPSVTTQFQVESSGTGGGGAYDLQWVNSTESYVVSSGDNEIDPTVSTSPAAHGATVEYAVNDSSLVEDGTNRWQRGRTNASGENTTTIPINTTELTARGGNATLRVFAASGGSGDRLDVRLTMPSGPPPSPVAELRVEDLTHLDTSNTRFYASYELENLGSDYSSTAVAFRNLDTGTTIWRNSTNRRGTASISPGGTQRDANEIEVMALDSSGAVLVSRTITDPSANGTNPAGNDALGTASSPAITSYTIADQSSNPNGIQYQIDWTADSTNFGSVQLDVFSLEQNGGSAQLTGQSSSGSQTLNTYGYSPSAQQQRDFRIQITLYDSEGVIVDTVSVIDSGDGTSP